MRTRRGLIALLAAAAAALSLGVLSTPAGALSTPTVSTTVFDASTNSAWSGSETTGASAYDTTTITGDGTNTPTGTVTYTLYPGAICTGVPLSTGQTVMLSGGLVPNSAATAALGAGTYSFDVAYSGDGNYSPPASDSCEPFTVAKGTPTASTTVFDAKTNAAWSNSEVTGASAYDTATVAGVNGFTPSGTVTYSYFLNGTCNGTPNTTQVVRLSAGAVPNSNTVGPFAAGSYSFQAAYGGDGNYTASSASSCEPFTVAKAPTTATTVVNDAGTNNPWGGSEVTGASAYDTATVGGDVGGFTPSGTVTYSYFLNGTCNGTPNTIQTVTLEGNGTVPNSNPTAALGAASYSFQAAYSGDANYQPTTMSSCEPFVVAQGTPNAPTITNLPESAIYSGDFTPVVGTNSNGVTSVTSSTPGVCTLSGPTVSYVGAGACSLTAHVKGTVDYAARDGALQTFTVGRASPSSPLISNIPGDVTEFGSFTAAVDTSGDGATSVSSNTTSVCTVGPDGHTVTFVLFGTCSLTASVAQGSNYSGVTGNPQTFNVNPALRGYWLVGSDGGIFSFGAAGFHGSMGGISLQRPVVGITPTASRAGYWLVASDGGIFSFGDSGFYGSIPGVGLHPAGSGLPNSLDAPIVGMVPTATGHGYFMVASDGGVFAFGDARFEGSCPGIGGCSGAAVAVMPDHSGNGYWLVTTTGGVYAFGDAPFFGGPAAASVHVVDAVATPDGRGYWILYANGAVLGYGDADAMGAPLGYVNSFNPATAIFPTADGHGYWVAAARGDVFSFGDAPYLGSMSSTSLNGEIIAGYGF